MKLTAREIEIYTEYDSKLKRVLVINPDEIKYRITMTVWKARKILAAFELIKKFVQTFE